MGKVMERGEIERDMEDRASRSRISWRRFLGGN